MKKFFLMILVLAFIASVVPVMAQKTDEVFVGKGKFEIPDNAGIKARKEKLVKFVQGAADFYKKEGKDKSFKEFSDPKGKFVDGELYLYVYDFKGVCAAHGADEKLVGKNLFDFEDADGFKLIQALISVAKDHEKGFQPFKWANPLTKKDAPKIGYVEKLDETYFVGSGIYMENEK